MAKRIADKELTDRNWDQEEEGEEVRVHVETVSLASGSWNYVSLTFLSSFRPGRFQWRVKMCLRIEQSRRPNAETLEPRYEEKTIVYLLRLIIIMK